MTAASALVLVATGVTLGYPEIVALGLACAAALAVAAVWRLLAPDLDVRRAIEPQRVVEGEEAQSRLTVVNRGRRRTPPIAAYELVGGRRVLLSLPSLGSGEDVTSVQSLPTRRRGRYVLPPLTLAHSDPFRLVEVPSHRGGESVLRVHPRVHRMAALPSGGARDLDGSTSSSSPQGGVAFHSLREYQPGDDWRLIHWRSTARTERLMVRHNVVPDEAHHLVVLDTSSVAYSDDEAFEEAVRVAASWCVAAVRDGCPVQVSTTGGHGAESVPAGRSPGGPVEVLDLLAEVARSRDDPGLPALARLVPTERMAALGVVTGQASATHLALLPSVRSRVTSLSLARVGGRYPAIDLPLRGVLSVSASSSDGIAARWNELVRR